MWDSGYLYLLAAGGIISMCLFLWLTIGIGVHAFKRFGEVHVEVVGLYMSLVTNNADDPIDKCGEPHVDELTGYDMYCARLRCVTGCDAA